MDHFRTPLNYNGKRANGTPENAISVRITDWERLLGGGERDTDEKTIQTL